MDGVAYAETKTTTLKEAVFANELLSVFESYADEIKVLSLDCFDTLLWRKTATPIDVFYDLQHRPAFKKIGFTALMRSQYETYTRSVKAIQNYTNEVCLRDIYRFTYPDLSESDLHALEEDELAAEIDAIYAFPPLIKLIRAAHAKKIPVIIVSDTYFKQAQLTRLLAAHLPRDVMQMIQTIFCSCDYGRSKSFGIFPLICNQLAISPEKILHIGDNLLADCLAARRDKIRAIHLMHHSEYINEVLRMQTVAAKMLDSSIRDKRSMGSPYRGFFAAQQQLTSSEDIIGYVSLGQVMYAFGKFILNEISLLQTAGKKLKVVFLMRDAYLPALACEALHGEPLGKCLNISRYASYAATFRTREDVDRYLMTMLATERFDSLLNQLLISGEMADAILKATYAAKDHKRAFVELVHREETLQFIFKKSSAYFHRLKRYLEDEIALEKNDSIMLVDIGYSGTTQKLLAPILKKEMNIDVCGRYLISLCVPGWHDGSRRGLIDATWCDNRSLHALIIYCALLEQLCTSNGSSVVDYNESGQPMLADSAIGNQQCSKLRLIQTACLRFIADANRFFQENNISIESNSLRETALNELTRLLYFPTAKEIACLETFEFELNLGTDDVLQVLDQEQGLASLRRRGILFTHMERHGVNMRTNIPAEIRSQGLNLAVMLFSHHRFGFELVAQDMSFKKETIDVIVIQNNQATQAVIEAHPTYDGFYALNIPIGDGSFPVGILWGRQYAWVQFESVERINAQAFFRETESLYTENYWDKILLNQMLDHGQQLFECQSLESLMMIPAAPTTDLKKHVVRVTFRPIAIRQK